LVVTERQVKSIIFFSSEYFAEMGDIGKRFIWLFILSSGWKIN
jgi:hypothetical protein